MNALSKGRMTSAQRNYFDKYAGKEVQRQYDKEINNAENYGKYLITAVACEVLEDVFEFGDRRRKKFIDALTERSEELNKYIRSNVCVEGNSDTPIFDKDYNTDIFERYAERYGLKFDEKWLEY